MEISSEALQIIILGVQAVGLPVIGWGIKKLNKIHRGSLLNDIKTEALVDTLSKQFGNGEFRQKFDKNVVDKKSDYKFVNHGK